MKVSFEVMTVVKVRAPLSLKKKHSLFKKSDKHEIIFTWYGPVDSVNHFSFCHILQMQKTCKVIKQHTKLVLLLHICTSAVFFFFWLSCFC